MEAHRKALCGYFQGYLVFVLELWDDWAGRQPTRGNTNVNETTALSSLMYIIRSACYIDWGEQNNVWFNAEGAKAGLLSC